MDHIAIILVHYNESKDTRECLESLLAFRSTQFRYNIIIVDNGSQKPLKFPKQLMTSSVEILRSEANLGFTGGNNLGISHATKQYQSDYFLLLNNDTIVAPEFAQQLYAAALANPQVGLVSSKIYFYKNKEYHSQSYARSQRGRVIWYAGGSIDWTSVSAFHRGIDELDRGQFDAPALVDFTTGCSMLIRREVVERIGILDKRYFLYFEDVDYSLRAKQAGFLSMMEPSSVVWHKNAGSSDGSGSRIHLYYQSRNRLYLALRHGSTRAKFTALRLIFQLALRGSLPERQAVRDFLLHRMGKQPIM